MAFNNNYPKYNSNPRSGNYPQKSGGYGNKNFTKKSSNEDQTDGAMFTNEKVGKFLRTRFWNRCMGIDIGTYAAGSPLNYETIRNAQVFGHVFAFSTLFELHAICEEVLESLKQTNRFESTATEAGQKKDVIVEISNGSNINMPAGIYLVIYKSVDAGKRTNIMDYYQFGGTKVLRNYDHNTGSATEDIKGTGEFKRFMLTLKEAAKAFTMAQAHAIKEAGKTDRMTTMNALTAISAALGVDIMKSVTAAASTTGQSNYNHQSAGNPNNFQRQSQPGQWNNRPAQFNGTPAQSGNYQSGFQKTQAAMNAMTDEPVDINLDAAGLQQVTMDSFK